MKEGENKAKGTLKSAKERKEQCMVTAKERKSFQKGKEIGIPGTGRSRLADFSL